MKRLIALTILATVAAGGLTAASAQRGQSTPGAEKSTQGNRPTTIELDECRIKLKEHAILATDRPGILASIKYKEGQKVKKGEQVARLKDDVAIAAYNVAMMKANDETEIEFAIKARDQADLEVKKKQDINRREPGAISEIEVQRAILEHEKSKASVKKSEMQKKILTEQAKEAKAQLDTYRIVAPFNGTVKSKLKSEGEAVRQGDPILEIVNTETVIVEGYIDYRDRPHVKVGNKVTVQLQDIKGNTSLQFELSGKPHPGKIVFIDQIAQAVTKKILIKAEIANPKAALYPGLTARMVIEPGTEFKE